MAGITARRVVVALDCPDARELAEFYASIFDWRICHDADYSDWVDVLPPEGEPGTIALARRAGGTEQRLRNRDRRQREG